ncbi:hypothetical protein LJR290_007479 [Variovorax sp. LjRoot290]|uniref:hypothetical protein n=1 Tax=Variovorax sp. LjRoot290 TaxID=3342316 RepID=UPI003ECF0792
MTTASCPPPIVYHGTGATFDAFAPNERGIFFAERFNAAAAYQRIRRDAAPRVIAARLDIRNPWTAITYGADVPYRDQIDQSVAAIAARGFDGIYLPKERVWVATSPHQITVLDHAVPLASFAANMQAAADQSQAGWYFEEGGCWGMALALRSALGGEIVLRDDFLHAYVRADGKTYAWQGESTFAGGRVVTRDQLVQEALGNGCAREQLDADTDWADQIIERARHMCFMEEAATENELSTQRLGAPRG